MRPFILALLAIQMLSCQQDLTCADFREGTFYIPVDPDNLKYATMVVDSVGKEPFSFVAERGNEIKKYIVIRNATSQQEWINEIGNGPGEIETIEWVDDCTYRLKIIGDPSKMDDASKEINENGGLLIENLGIKGRCMEYKATNFMQGGHKIYQLGLICKE